ncbi:MAG: hypothetical protein LWW93_14230 [Hyphomicrobiales bacterium]|nr:hypothetical protein [Hyphomicrobiales bacterium]
MEFSPVIETSAALRLLAASALLGAAVSLGGCSGATSSFESDYVSPIAATPAPPPPTPVAAGAPAPARRMPLLPPVPGEEGSNGLPPITVAALLPPGM